MRNPEDGYIGCVRLVTALVPLLKGTLLKEGSGEELAASSIADDLVTEGVVDLGTSSTADDSARRLAELGPSSTDEAFAGGGFAVCVNSALAEEFAIQWKSKSYNCDCHRSLGYRHGHWRRA